MIELFQAPSHWAKATLGELCEIRGGVPAPQDEAAWAPGGVPFVRMKDVGREHFTRNLCTTDQALSKEYFRRAGYELTPRGAILLPRSGSVALNHRAILATDAVIVSHLCALVRKSDRITDEFLYRYLCRIDMRKLTKKTTGLDSLAFSDLRRIAVAMPPLADQRRIVELLDRAEALRVKRREGMAELDVLGRAMFIDLFGDPVRNPKGWPIRRLSELGTLDRGVSRHRPRNEPSLLGGPYPLIQTGEVANSDGYIRDFAATYSEAGLRQSKIWPAGTLCITIAANIAKTGILMFDACFPDSVVGFRTENEATVLFVQVWLSFLQKTLEQTAPEVAQKNINLAILRDLEVVVPPVALQEEFARRLKATETLRSARRRWLQLSDEFLSSIQHRAFAGEL